MDKLAYSIPKFVELSGLGRTTIYEAIKTGALPVIRHGRRVLIADDTGRKFLKSRETTLPAMKVRARNAAPELHDAHVKAFEATPCGRALRKVVNAAGPVLRPPKKTGAK